MYRNTSHTLLKRAFPSNRWWNGQVNQTSVLESDKDTTVTVYRIHLYGDRLGQETWWLKQFIDNLRSASVFVEQWKLERLSTYKYVFTVTTRLNVEFVTKENPVVSDDEDDLSWLNN